MANVIPFLLPWVFLVVLFLHLAGRRGRRGEAANDLHTAYLAAVSISGALLVGIVEALSLFRAITRLWLGLAWTVAVGVVALAGWRQKTVSRGWVEVRSSCEGTSFLERLILAGVCGLCVCLLLIALVSPPNTVDSLFYHMGRVVNWAQNQHLGHYPTGNYAQNTWPIWAEVAILNLRVLWGSDRPANLVQWFSMVTGLVAVSGVAKLMGANREGQLATVGFAVSVPMGILQATSTQNDYVVAMWTICLLYFTVRSKMAPSSAFPVLLVGISLGLGMLTKGTFYASALPILLWLFLPRPWRVGVLRTIAEALAVSALAIVLNLGYWTRNFLTYGGPFGQLERIGLALPNEPPFQASTLPATDAAATATPEGQAPSVDSGTSIPDAGSSGAGDSRITTRAWEVFVSRSAWFGKRIADLMALNTVIPTSYLRSIAWGWMLRLPWLFGPGYVASLREGIWNHEDCAGNLLHLTLALIATLAGLVLATRRRELRIAAQYGLVAFAGYAMLAWIPFSTMLFSVRYQLAYLLASAPLVGAVAAHLTRKTWPTRILALGLLASAMPYLLLNNTRPLVGWIPATRINSVFTTPQVDILYAMAAGFQDEDIAVARQVLGSGCTNVALKIDYNDFDYPWWWLLRAPQSGVRIAYLVVDFPLQRYVDPAFTPCAIICTICAGEPEVGGLPLLVDYGHVQLFGLDGIR